MLPAFANLQKLKYFNDLFPRKSIKKYLQYIIWQDKKIESTEAFHPSKAR